MFELLRIEYSEGSTEMILHLSRNHYFPEKFNSENYEKDEVKLIGISEPKNLHKKLSEFLNDSIDIEKLENGKLDFWCDQIQIGEFEVEKFEERTLKFNKTDWIESYEYLLNEYLKKREINIKENRIYNEFTDKVEKFIEKERNKNKLKFTFFNTDSNKKKLIKEKNNLIDKFENIKNHYLEKLRNI